MGGEWSDTTEWPSKAHTRFERLERISVQRRHLFTVEHAQAAGIPASTLRSRAEMRRVHRVYRGVYSFAPPPFGRHQLWLAAVLAGGPGALLSDLPTAALYELVDGAPAPHVNVMAGRGSRLDGIVVHRRTVAPADRLIRDGIPCTGPARTIFDLASTLPEAELERILVLADSRRLLDLGRLEQLLRDLPGQRGAAKLRRLLAADPLRVRSEVELTFARRWRRAGIAAPLANARIVAEGRRFEVDFCWPADRVVVEIDGYAFHGGRARANADRDREQLLELAGWRVHRFTADQVRGDPDEVIRRLRRLIGHGGARM